MASMPEIKLNKETIGFAMGLVALVTSGIGAYNWLLDGRAENSPVVRDMIIKNAEQDKRLDRTDEDRQNNTAALKEQTAETQKLKEVIVKLTTVMERNGGPTKKAEYSPIESIHRPFDTELQ